MVSLRKANRRTTGLSWRRANSTVRNARQNIGGYSIIAYYILVIITLYLYVIFILPFYSFLVKVSRTLNHPNKFYGN
jgi:hypothetical protein